MILPNLLTHVEARGLLGQSIQYCDLIGYLFPHENSLHFSIASDE